MQDIQDILTTHRSIRKYKPDPISDDLLNELLLGGLRGASSGNMQTWSVVVTRDPANKQKLYDAHFGQPMVLQAPVVLTFCADVFRMREWIRVNESKQSFDDILGFLTGAIDAAIVAQNVCVGAEAAGLGICYMGTTWWSADKIIDILQLPECVFPITSIVLGYPDEAPEVRDRLPLELMVHHETYRRMSDDEIIDVHAERAKSAWERYNASPSTRAKIKELGLKKVTDYYTSEIKYSKELHRRVSDMLIETLQKQKLWR